MAKIFRPAIVIHAGAGKHLGSQAKEDRARKSLRRIIDEAYRRLQRSSALDTVVWAVTQLEDDPQFNSGTGAKLQSDGTPRLTASLMDGYLRRFSGVLNIEQVKNPVLVARALLKEKDRVLAAAGASMFARAKGHAPYNPITEESWSEWKRKHASDDKSPGDIFGTVGAVAVDLKGRLAASTSTGGKGMEIVGRVSDSATIAGTYASDQAAVSATGVGEEIVEVGLAHRIVTRVDDGMALTKAFEKTFKEAKAHKGRMGAIGVDAKGNVFIQATTECILHAFRTPKDSGGYP